MGVMDNMDSAVSGSGLRRRSKPMDLVPTRLLDPQTLGQPPRRSGATVRLGAVLLALALAGVGGGLLLVRPSRAGVVVSDGHVRVTSVDLPHRGTELFHGAGVIGVSSTASLSGLDGGEVTE